MFRIISIAINFFVSIFDKSWNYSKKSYSQEGEDLILADFFENKKNGFYIDVGAYHPFRFSNTYLFYKKGWRGINIDATPDSMNLFEKYRPRDINIETAISNRNEKIKYFVFDEPALNSFSGKLSNERDMKTQYKIKKIIQLRTRKLSEILDKNLPPRTKIDFMSIDVEGYEYEVLSSNNWRKYRPTFILVEMLRRKFTEMGRGRVSKFLLEKNYSIIGFTGRTVIIKNGDENSIH